MPCHAMMCRCPSFVGNSVTERFNHGTRLARLLSASTPQTLSCRWKSVELTAPSIYRRTPPSPPSSEPHVMEGSETSSLSTPLHGYYWHYVTTANGGILVGYIGKLVGWIATIPLWPPYPRPSIPSRFRWYITKGGPKRGSTGTCSDVIFPWK